MAKYFSAYDRQIIKRDDKCSSTKGGLDFERKEKNDSKRNDKSEQQVEKIDKRKKILTKENVDTVDIEKLMAIFGKLRECLIYEATEDYINKQQGIHESAIIYKQQQPKHVRVFLVMLLCYLRELAFRRLKEKVGDESLEDKDVLYKVSFATIQKAAAMLGDDYRTGLEEIALVSGILQKSNKGRELQKINRGQDFLPMLLQKEMIEASSIDLPMRAYYVQVEINDKYMQLMLYQVVGISSDDKKEVTSAITIREETIGHENMQDTVCKNMWNCIQSTQVFLDRNQQCRKCNHHNNDPLQDEEHIFTLKNYLAFSSNLKHYLVS